MSVGGQIHSGFDAWVNRGKEPCRIVFVLMDSKQP